VDETRLLVFKLGKNVVVERENKVMLGIEGEIALNKKKGMKKHKRGDHDGKDAQSDHKAGTNSKSRGAASGVDKSELQSVDDDDLIQMNGKGKVLINNSANDFVRMNTADSQKRKQVNFQQENDDKLVPQIVPGILRKQTATMPGSGPMKMPYGN
jgi:hypothetical protein